MPHKPRPSAWFTGIIGLALLAGCQAPRQAGSLVTAAQPAPGARPSEAPVPQGGIGGVASLLGENFAGADIKVYKAGQAEPVGTGTTRADGTFTVALGVAGVGVATGAPLKVVASRNGQTLVAIGAAGIISGGAGNIISGGAGNIISGGAGNIISGGAGNYGVLAVDMNTRVSVETTLAVLKLGDALDEAMAQMGAGGASGDAAVEKMFEALATLTAAATQTLRDATPEQLVALTQAFSPLGLTTGPLSAEVSAMAATLTQAAAAATALINQAVATATAPETPAAGNTPQTGGTQQTGTSSSGGGSSGSEGAEEDEDETSGTVTLTPNFQVPLKVTQPPPPYAAGLLPPPPAAVAI